MLGDIDRNLSVLTEGIARRFGRRQVLVTGSKGLFATVAALAVGQVIKPQDALAGGCTCSWLGGVGNANCPSQGGCPSFGCPAGCSTCTTADGCSGCIYDSGSWVSCSGLGTCGNGYQLCVDCKCGSCSSTCTCLQGCTCCGCCRPADFEAELRRIAELSAAA